MTEVIENTDIDLTILLDWETEATCQFYMNYPGDTDCPNEADWIASSICGCATDLFVCNSHKEFIETQLLLFPGSRKCLFCGYVSYGNPLIFRKI